MVANSDRDDCMKGVLTTYTIDPNKTQSVYLAHGRFASVASCQHKVNDILYQYVRIKKSPMMACGIIDTNFKQIIVIQAQDSELSFIILEKSSTYQTQTEVQIETVMKKHLMRDNDFTSIDCLYTPAFQCFRPIPAINAFQDLQVDKTDRTSFINNMHQTCSVEFYSAPISDGTPMLEPKASANGCGLIENSFVFVTVTSQLNKTLEMPLAIVHVEKDKDWKRLF